MGGLKRSMDRHNFLEHSAQLRGLQRIRPVGLGFFGVVVDFQEHAIHARPHGRPRQHRDKFRLPPARCRSIVVSVRG